MMQGWWESEETARGMLPVWVGDWGGGESSWRPGSPSSTRRPSDLVAPNTVNAMPEATLFATEDHGQIRGNAVAGTYEQARAHLDAVEKLGISYAGVVQSLETEGIQKFQQSWDTLLNAVRAAR